MQTEWWRAGEVDQFSLKEKLIRVGCRPLKRKYLQCKKTVDELDLQKYTECKKIRSDMDECYKALNYLHIAMKQEECD